MLISKIFIVFIIYSLMGWIWESIYCTLKEGEWQTRGFLFGPICPIYGVGASSVSLLFTYVPILHRGTMATWQLFLFCALGSAIVEYLTSLILEKVFHAKWWDYSGYFLNIHGRVCVEGLLVFGLGGLLVIYLVAPIISSIIKKFNKKIITIVCILLFACFLGDEVYSTFNPNMDATVKIIKNN